MSSPVARGQAALLTTLLAALVTTALLAVGAGAVPAPAPAHARPLPPHSRWESDVRAALHGSVSYLQRRVRRARVHGTPPGRLALNLDVDNTALASAYRRGAPVRPTLRLARAARDLGVRVFFNTARPVGSRAVTARALRRAGYPVDRLCLARRGERVRHSKQRCRASFAADGFRLVVNVGNRSTDFVGGGYERRYRLPDYGGRLG